MNNNSDTYQIEFNHILCENEYKSLFLLYQQLLDSNSINLYLLLYIDKDIKGQSISIKRLINQTNLSIKELNNAITKLEQFNLVITYEKKIESHSNFIYLLNKPLSYNEIMNNPIYSSLLMKNSDKENLYYTSLIFEENINDKKDYINISSKFDINLLRNIKEDEINTLKYFKTKEIDEIKYQYDIEKFLRNINELCFPKIERTKENLNIIAKNGSFYGIDIETMKKIVTFHIDSNGKFNESKFEKEIMTYTIPKINSENKYDLPCVQFLRSFQDGTKLIYSEIKLLDNLAHNLKLKNEVINAIVEYSLNNNDNRLNNSYVEKVAVSLKRNNIETYQDAIEYMHKDTTNKPKSKVKPIKVIKKRIDEVTKSEVSSEELAMIKKWQSGN